MDVYEPDDQWLLARAIAADGSSHAHTSHAPGDVDFVKFAASAGSSYVMRAFELGGRPFNDTTLTLYGPDGQTPLAYNDDHEMESPGASRIEWTAPDSATYFLKVAQFNPASGGCAFTYLLQVARSSPASSPPALALPPRPSPRPP
jgi:hypothetical protein